MQLYLLLYRSKACMSRVYRSSVKETTRKAPWKAPILILLTMLILLLRRLLILLLLRRLLILLLLRRLLRQITLLKLSLIPLMILIPLLKFRLIRLILIMLLLILCRVHRLGWTRLWRWGPNIINYSKSRAPTLPRPRQAKGGHSASFSLCALPVGADLPNLSLSVLSGWDISTQKAKNL